MRRFRLNRFLNYSNCRFYNFTFQETTNVLHHSRFILKRQYSSSADSKRTKELSKKKFFKKYKRTLKRFQYCSDLHIDKNGFPEVEPIADHLIIAGDLCNGWTPQSEAFIEKLTRDFETVNFVPGNHDFYYEKGETKGIHGVLFKMRETEKKLFPKFNVLNNEITYFEGDGKKISDVLMVGTTLWSGIPDKHCNIYQKQFYDFKRIRKDEEGYLTVGDYNRMHQESIDFLKDVYMNTIIPHSLMDHSDVNSISSLDSMPIVIFVSHHAPVVKQACNSYYLRNRLRNMNHAFCTDLSSMLNRFTLRSTDIEPLNEEDDINAGNIDVLRNTLFAWIFGHTHYRNEFIHDSGIHFGTNSLGNVHKSSKRSARVMNKTIDSIVFK